MKTDQQNKLNDIMRDVELKNKQSLEKIQSNSKEKDRFQQLKYNLPLTKNLIQQKILTSTQVASSIDLTKKIDSFSNFSQQKLQTALEKLNTNKNNEQDIHNTILQKENQDLTQENKKLSNDLQILTQKNSEIEEKMKERGKHVKDFLNMIQQKDQEIKDIKAALEKVTEEKGTQDTVLKEGGDKNSGVKEFGIKESGDVKLLEYVQFLENQYKKLELKYKKKQIDLQQLKQKLNISRQELKMQIKEQDNKKETDSNSNNNSDLINQEKQQNLESQQQIIDLKSEINRIVQEYSIAEKNNNLIIAEKDNQIETMLEEIVQLKAQDWMKKYEQLELLHNSKLETLLSKSDIQEKEISKATLEAKNEKEKRIRIEKSSKLLEIKINNLNQELEKSTQNYNNIQDKLEQSSNDQQKLKRKQQNDLEKQNLFEKQIEEISKEKQTVEEQLEQLNQKYNNQKDNHLVDLKKNKEYQETLLFELDNCSKNRNEINFNIQILNKQIKTQEKNIKQQEIIIQGLKVIEQENLQLKNKEEKNTNILQQIIDENIIKIRELTTSLLESNKQLEQSSTELQILKIDQKNFLDKYIEEISKEKETFEKQIEQLNQKYDQQSKEKEAVEQQLEQLNQKYDQQRDNHLEDLKKNKQNQESLYLEQDNCVKNSNEMKQNIQRLNEQIKKQEKIIKKQEIIIQELKVDKAKIQQENEAQNIKYKQIIDENSMKIKELTSNLLESKQKIQLYEQNYSQNEQKINENLEQQIINNTRLQQQINEFQGQIEEQYEKYQNLKHQKEQIQIENEENELKIKQIIEQNQQLKLQKDEKIQNLNQNFTEQLTKLQQKSTEDEQIFSQKLQKIILNTNILKAQNIEKQEKLNNHIQLEKQLENQILNDKKKQEQLIQNHDSSIQDYKNQINALEKKLEDLQQQQNVIKEMNEKLRNQSDITMDLKIQEMSLLKIDLQTKISENQDLAYQILQSQEILTQYSDSHQKIQSELQNQLQKLSQDQQNLQQQKQEYQQQIINQQQQLDQKENQIIQINLKQSEEFDTQQKIITQMQQQNNKLIEEKQLLIKQRQLMQANFEHLENFQKELYEEKNQQAIKEKNLHEQLSKNDQQIELMHQEYTNLDEQSKQLNEQYAFLQTQLLNQQQENKIIREKLKEKEQFSTKQDQQINDLSQQIKKLEENIALLQDKPQQDNQSILIDKQKEIIELNTLNQSLKNQIYDQQQNIQILEDAQRKEQEEDTQKIIQSLQEANDYLTQNLEQIMKEKKEQEERVREWEEKAITWDENNQESQKRLRTLEEGREESLLLQGRLNQEQEKLQELQNTLTTFQSTIISNFQNLKNNKYTIDIASALNFDQQDEKGEIFIQQLNLMFKLIQKNLKEKYDLFDSKKEFDLGMSLSCIEGEQINAFNNESGDPLAIQAKQPQTLLEDNIQPQYLHDMHSLNEIQLRKELQQAMQKLSRIGLENEDLKKNLNSFHSQVQPNTYNILDNQKVWYELMETKAEMDHIKIVLEQYKEAVNEHEENEDRLSNKIKKLKDHISQIEVSQKSPEFHENEHQKKIFLKFFDSYFEQGQDVDQLMIILCSLFNCSDEEKKKLTTGLQKIQVKDKKQSGVFKNLFK